MGLTRKVADRLASAIKGLRPAIEQQRARDVSEADTVTLVKDILSAAFGYDKYTELTSEHAIRGTYCDIAISVEGKTVCLVEVKSAGTNLDDRHVKQAIDYAANKGVEWCILTNGVEWRLYNVVFSKPIDKHEICRVDLSAINLKSDADLERLFAFTKEGFDKGAHTEMRDRLQATSRHLLAALIVSNEDVLAVIRRELRKIVDLMISEDEARAALEHQVIKRDCLDGPEADAARAKVARKRTNKPATKVSDEARPSTKAPGTAIATPPTEASATGSSGEA
jgi:predicted type IV restriction endonuclease